MGSVVSPKFLPYILAFVTLDLHRLILICIFWYVWMVLFCYLIINGINVINYVCLFIIMVNLAIDKLLNLFINEMNILVI
jgi:hypothetical protein